MTGEIATCTVLLICATLCVRSLRNASSINPGFNAQHVIAATLNPGSLGYSEAQVRNFYEQLSKHVRTLPGVTAASFTDHLPLGPAREQTAILDPMRPESGENDAISIDILRVAPDYFQTMGISLLRGRDFVSSEGAEGSGVAIINEALAKRLRKNQDPVGQRMTFFARPGEKSSTEVIGVVPTGKYRTLGEDPVLVAYLPQLRARRTLVVRTTGETTTLLDNVRREIHSVDPNVAATDLETMQQYMSLPLFPARTTGLLLGVSGFLALALTTIGLFGVISYIVSQRTHEIGVRMALGARPRDVLKFVVGHGCLKTCGWAWTVLDRDWLGRRTRCCIRGSAPPFIVALRNQPNGSRDVRWRGASVVYRGPSSMLRPSAPGDTRGPYGGSAVRVTVSEGFDGTSLGRGVNHDVAQASIFTAAALRRSFGRDSRASRRED